MTHSPSTILQTYTTEELFSPIREQIKSLDSTGPYPTPRYPKAVRRLRNKIGMITKERIDQLTSLLTHQSIKQDTEIIQQIYQLKHTKVELLDALRVFSSHFYTPNLERIQYLEQRETKDPILRRLYTPIAPETLQTGDMCRALESLGLVVQPQVALKLNKTFRKIQKNDLVQFCQTIEHLQAMKQPFQHKAFQDFSKNDYGRLRFGQRRVTYSKHNKQVVDILHRKDKKYSDYRNK